MNTSKEKIDVYKEIKNKIVLAKNEKNEANTHVLGKKSEKEVKQLFDQIKSNISKEMNTISTEKDKEETKNVEKTESIKKQESIKTSNIDAAKEQTIENNNKTEDVVEEVDVEDVGQKNARVDLEKMEQTIENLSKNPSQKIDQDVEAYLEELHKNECLFKAYQLGLDDDILKNKTADQLEILIAAKEENFNLLDLINKDYNVDQMKQILYGMEQDINYKLYSNNLINAEKMETLREKLVFIKEHSPRPVNEEPFEKS